MLAQRANAIIFCSSRLTKVCGGSRVELHEPGWRMFEVEQKYPVTEVARLLPMLDELGAELEGEYQQADHYFNHPQRDFATTDEALRIRSVGKANFVTYKGPKIDTETKTRRELELPLAAGHAAASDFAELLSVLGFRPVAWVRKSRRQFQLDWERRRFEIALDDVAGVGQFVELETQAAASEVPAARDSLQRLAGRLGLSRVERRSYLELLLASETPAGESSGA